MEDKDAHAILERIQRGTASGKELLLFDQWYFQYHHQHIQEYSEAELQTVQEEMRAKLPVRQSNSEKRSMERSLLHKWSLIAVAASVLLLSGIAWYLFNSKSEEINKPSSIKYSNDISPGGDKAYLTLANGKRISLSDAKNGELAEESGIKIIKLANGEISYQVTDKEGSSLNKNIIYNLIETPRGGQYQISLPDGTKVWLNAASTIKFPSSFARLVNRRVELLSGEAYFEVAKDSKHPFIVMTEQQELRVLGTHFNIEAYPDESAVKTTLIEGKVQLTSTHSSTKFILEPGQQAALTNNSFTVKQGKIEEAMAWRNNKFVFDNENIEGVMKKIERWYNVTVTFQGEKPDDKFTGSVSRFDQLSTVLDVLELTGNVHFQIEGRRVLVRK